MEDRQNTSEFRDYTYDWVRIIATLFVVIGHSVYLNIQTTYGGVAYELPSTTNQAYYSKLLEWYRWLPDWIYGFHMPLFFMLSGAVMALKPLAKMDIIVRSKIKRLLIPYFFYAWLFMLPVKRIGGFYTNASLKQALKGVLSGADGGHLWFLPTLFWTIIAFVVLKKILDRFNVSSIYILLFGCGVIQLTYDFLPFNILNLKTGLSYIFWFALGYVFECERKQNARWSIKKSWLASVILVVLELINKRYDVLNEFFLIVLGSFLTFVVSDILCRSIPNAPKSKIWKIVTRNLFYIYIFHDPMEYIVLRIFINGNVLDFAAGCYLYVFTRTFVIIVTSIILGEIMSYIKRKINTIVV